MNASLLKIHFSSLLILTMAGCAGMAERHALPPALSLEQIVAKAKEGKEPQAIIDEIRATRAVYDISASQYAKLSKDGVADAVLDFLQQGQLRMAQREGRREAYQDMWMNTRFGWPGFAGYSGYAWRGPWIPRPYVVYVEGKASKKEF